MENERRLTVSANRWRGCRKWILWFAWGVGGLVGGVAYAAESNIVGVVSQQLVMEKSKTGKKALEELKVYSAARQKIIGSDEEELKELEKAAQDSSLKEEERREKEGLFRTKLEAYQRRIQGFNRDIQVKQKEMVEQYGKLIDEAALAVARRRGYAAVIDEGAEGNLKIVIYHQPSVDVTDEVIKEFDSRSKAR